MMKNFDLTHDNLAVERLGVRRTQDMIAALEARADWASDPVLRVRLVSDHGGTLIVRVGLQRTVASLITADKGLFAGFDDDGHGAWPTVVAVSGMDDDPEAEGDTAAAARAILGDVLRVAAQEAAVVPGDWVSIPLDRAEADALRAVWDQLDIHPLVTDELLETTIASWSTELSVAGATGRASADQANAVTIPTSIQDDGVFEGLVGRSRGRTEPFPIAEVHLDARVSNIQLTVDIDVPEGARPTGVVSADVMLEGRTWNVILEQDHAQPTKFFGSRLLPADVPPSIIAAAPGIRLTVQIS
jgi:hypothetical protein